MLLGVYLLLPLLRALVKGASRRELWYVVGLWGIVAAGSNTLYAFFPQGLGRVWLNMLRLQSLSGFVGYVILGYLLRTCRTRPWWEGLCYALGLLGLVTTCTGTRLLSIKAGVLDVRLYEYLTPNVCFTAVAIFLLARRLNVGKHPLWAKLSALTFGSYLIHPIFIHLCKNAGLPRESWSVVWAVPLQALLIYAAALAASWAVRRIPKVGKYIC